MKYSDTGFRGIYQKFCVFPLSRNVKKAVKGFSVMKRASGVLTYGYIDNEAGLTLEVLAAANEENGSYSFTDLDDEVTVKLRMESVQDDEFDIIDDPEGSLNIRYKYKLEMLEIYESDDAVRESRQAEFLDFARNEYYPDDVLVHLIRDGLQPEGCWARLVELGEDSIIGQLLNEPDQDFGCHEGDKISMLLYELDDDSNVLIADMSQELILTEEMLEDGELLKQAVRDFNSERNEQNLLEVVSLLRDSYVWVPCNAVMSDRDMESLSAEINEFEDDLDALAGRIITNQDPVRLIPDILYTKEDGKYFFPVFSSEEEMGEYGEHFSSVQKHMLEVIPMARNNEKDVSGIVLNAFSEPFVLSAELFDLVEELESRIVDDQNQKKN
ncbi:MAG: SseB family protein [Anaerovoracaceae bacterium]|jgi:hypothetical protein